MVFRYPEEVNYLFLNHAVYSGCCQLELLDVILDRAGMSHQNNEDVIMDKQLLCAPLLLCVWSVSTASCRSLQCSERSEVTWKFKCVDPSVTDLCGSCQALLNLLEMKEVFQRAVNHDIVAHGCCPTSTLSKPNQTLNQPNQRTGIIGVTDQSVSHSNREEINYSSDMYVQDTCSLFTVEGPCMGRVFCNRSCWHEGQ